MISLSNLKNLKHVELGRIPNLRRLIIPDPGYTIVDMDLDRADAQFVAWEANDEGLKATLKAGEDLHTYNARAIWPSAPWDQYNPEDPLPILKGYRDLAKRFCHGANYGAYPKRLAKALGIPQRQAEQLWYRWFQIHPAIRQWHQRIERQVAATRTITNPFGYTRTYFERPSDVLNKSLAWIPQSSVAIVINTAMCNIMETFSPDEVEVLMQVHDSLTMQVRTDIVVDLLPEIERLSLIPIPYPDPLTIPVGFTLSDKSWGDVKTLDKYLEERAKH